MTLKIVETTVTEETVRVRIANNADPTKATRWVDIQAPVSDLTVGHEAPLGIVKIRRLAAIHQAVLRYARDAIDAEIDALEALDGRNYR
jgi:hypothetical protein